tara:strand:- start:282 stop:677 length:396 start_codon:yes stop_codon:yes gene_type:complete
LLSAAPLDGPTPDAALGGSSVLAQWCKCLLTLSQPADGGKGGGGGGGGGDRGSQSDYAAIEVQLEALLLHAGMSERLPAAAAWAQRSGATSVADVVTFGFVDEFVLAVAPKPVPARKLRTALKEGGWMVAR